MVDLRLRRTVEMMGLARRRLEAQAETLRALGRCGSVTDAANLQPAFLSQAVSDYRTETTILSQDVRGGIREKAA